MGGVRSLLFRQVSGGQLLAPYPAGDPMAEQAARERFLGRVELEKRSRGLLESA